MSKENNNVYSDKKLRMMVQIGMLGALATILMMFQIPLPFFPPFYKFDFSEVPVLVGSLVLGPMAGTFIELVKIAVIALIEGSTTAGIGEAANFLIGCSFSVTAGVIYRKMRTRKGAVISLAVGVAAMTVVGSLLNAFVLLPVYADAFEMPLDKLVAMGTAVNKNITSLTSFVLFAVAPFNLLKGTVVSLIVFLIYKKIKPLFHMR